MVQGEGHGNATSWPVLAATAAEELVLPTVQGVHRAVSANAFRWVGPAGRPTQRVVERATAVSYLGVRALLRGVTLGLDRHAHRRRPPAGAGARPGAALRSRAVAAGVGDARFRTRAGLREQPMTVHVPGRAEPVAVQEVGGWLPGQTGRVVVLVHGLMDTEHLWRGSPTVPGLPAVATGSAAAVLLVRYDTGRPVADSAGELAALLDSLEASWPGGLRQLVLVGYSMGGLVIRGALLQAERDGRTWPAAVSDVLHLATPHLGSWLEKTANLTAWTLRHASPVSAPIGQLLDRRSPGIKDLRFGTGLSGPRGDDPDGLLAGWGPVPPWHPTARAHLVTGRLHPSRRHPLNLLVGDALVRSGSARGHGSLRRVHGDARVTEIAAGHLDLVGRAAVGEVLRGVLATPPPVRRP